MNQTHRDYRLESKTLAWLREAGPSRDDAPSDNALAAWVLRKMSRGEILDVGGVLVDRAVLDARFACVPERCSPAVARGRHRSCCADLEVSLSPTEKGRLLRRRRRLAEHLAKHRGPAAWLAEDGGALTRPGGRCAFSRLEKDGRIRCQLHAFAKQEALSVAAIQPHSCRLFPLALFELNPGQVLLTVLQKGNHKLLGVLPPQRFPCLVDEELPPLLDAMAGTVDALFGKGFARAVRRRG